MAHAKDVLSDQLLANANDPSWYLPFSDSVERLSEEHAFWTPNEESNSIAEIVQHLLYWNQTWQTRYQKSHVDAVLSIGNNNSFIISENHTFAALKKQLLEVLLRWQELLSEEKVEREVNGYPGHVKWWAILGNVSTHNAYHIGQIIYIRKLQNSWKIDAGVDE
ncbi:DinB family protein [Bacillus mycoides]|uniref:DinB family protein n=1 Tax=Bacillus cereus group TaxID=86661 RepID=UPI00103E76FD|nr:MULTISPECIES: DinB family protein [Bacillus cereus group]MBJ8009260.1 DinB family protein [Bacillus cereus]QWH15247.1 DinB family protein [Bacillus mycoides]TBX72022.1 DinB family protein [Bacillus mycoides]WJE23100.1 DinB family protein [Bacillus cereus]